VAVIFVPVIKFAKVVIGMIIDVETLPHLIRVHRVPATVLDQHIIITEHVLQVHVTIVLNQIIILIGKIPDVEFLLVHLLR
jgi:hypothetical protein